jgi:tetratricopeptide (TPR) repeat protein
MANAETEVNNSPDTGAEGEAISPEVTELSRKGYHLLKDGHITEAIHCFRHILENDPTNNYALVGIGDAYRKRRRYQEATDYYRDCLRQYPHNNYALFGLADCYRSMKHFHRAIEVWESYLKLDDQNVTVLTRVADAYRKVKNLERSEVLYNRVLEIEPGNPYALIGLGHLYYDFKLFEKALSYWMQMYEHRGDRADIRVLTSIGNCHRKRKTFQDGVPFFEMALEKEPKNFYALFGLADCYRGMNQQDQSLTYWNRILAQDPSNKVILTRAGDAYRKLGQLDTAEDYYRRALNIEYDTYAVLGLALINKIRGNIQDAADSLQGLLKSDPKILRIYPEILECYLHLGDRHSAKNVLEQYESTYSGKNDVHDRVISLRKAAGV